MNTKRKLTLFNSLSKTKEEFVPINDPQVGMYTCGFTVYDHTHIGHVKKYVGDDVLRRVLTYLGYEVKHVQNVTDVGHLESDADEGEDKLEKGAVKHNMTVVEVARQFEEEFYSVMDRVNVLRPNIVKRAADDDAIAKQIDLVKTLIEQGYAYIKDAAVYFDVSKLPDYNPFSSQELSEKLVGVRSEVEVDPEKRNPADFVLWMFKKGRYSNHAMSWDSPWGEGFPGWHIECSAISMNYLGDHFDIHTGGVDHLPVHHPNEIAQNFGVTGHKVVNYWVHHEHLKVDGEKMSKSKGNFYTLDDVVDKGFDPLALRYLILGTHYRKQMNFTWESLDAAQSALTKLRNKAKEYSLDSKPDQKAENEFDKAFVNAIADDLNTAAAIGEMWKMVDSDLSEADKLQSILKFDEVLGLGIGESISSNTNEVPDVVENLAKKRLQLRDAGEFAAADDLRTQIGELGYAVIDTDSGYEIKPTA